MMIQDFSDGLGGWKVRSRGADTTLGDVDQQDPVLVQQLNGEGQPK